MYRHLLIAAASAVALSACGQQATTTTEAPPAVEPAAPAPAQMSDADFVNAVGHATAFEIQSSQLAPRHASRADVKTFAAMMVRDHTAAGAQLTALAPTLNLPAPPSDLDPAMTDQVATLTAANGAAFDTAYINAQVTAHQQAVTLFENYVAGAPAGPLKDWANTTLPTLRTHLQNVQALQTAG